MGHGGENWFSLTLAGFRAAQAGDAGCAGARWAEAARVAHGALCDTPFHAVALTNLAAVAGNAFDVSPVRAPTAAWQALRDRAATEEMRLPARSSVFHLRLASRHADPFARFLRQRALALSDRGRWLAQANALFRFGPADAMRRHLASDDATLAPLPPVLEAAVRARREDRLDRALARTLLAAQVEDLAAAGPPDGLHAPFAVQLEVCLGSCAFAPLIDFIAPWKEPDA